MQNAAYLAQSLQVPIAMHEKDIPLLKDNLCREMKAQGILGNMVGPTLCKLVGITDEVAQGGSFGTSAHVIGTAKANEISGLTGAASSLSLVVAGLLTAVLMPVIAGLM